MKRSAEILESKCEDFLSSDNLTSFDDLKERLVSGDACIPSGFVIQSSENFIHLLYIMTDCENIPRLKACVTILKDMSVGLVVGDKLMPKSVYSDITPGATVSAFSQALNLMARAKSFSDNDYSIYDYAADIIHSLKKWQNEEDNDEVSRSLDFFNEQIRLLKKNKFARSYSTELMVMGYLIFATSAATYELLLEQKLLCLPSVCTLRKLTRKLSSENGLEIENYFRLRTAKLDGLECNVLLMIDEVYLSKRIEYSGAK